MDHNLLISLLMQQEYVSGEWISEQMGITRAAVWKAVEGLREKGWQVESVRKKGYRLVPPENAMWPSCIRRTLKTKWAGQRIDYYDQIGSTNAVIRELGQQDPALAPHGTLAVTDEQTAGRGRMTRSWQSKPGDAALMSLLIRPDNLPPTQAAALVQITALAVCEACRSFGADARIKWPNDIVCGGKKICGMLLDMNADMDLVHFAVAGVGLNIAGYPYAEDLQHASCLNEACGKKLDRAEVIAAFLTQFERYYDLWTEKGSEAIDEPYKKLCVTLNSRVQVISLRETFEGTAIGLDEGGSLIVRRDDGSESTVHAGDVSVRGIMGYV